MRNANKRDPVPSTILKLRRTLAIVWSTTWLMGLSVFAVAVIYLSDRYYDDQIDSRLRIQAIAIYGLAYIDEEGVFHSDLLDYEDELWDYSTNVWFVEPTGSSAIFHLDADANQLDKSKLRELATHSINEELQIFESGIDVRGNPYRLLAIPTYKGTDTQPIAAIIVCTDSSVVNESKWWFILSTLGATFFLGIVGILVGRNLAKWSLAPLAQNMSQRERFLSAAAHEMRTPMASIQAILESTDTATESSDSAISRLRPLIDRANGNMEKLLLFARLDAGNSPVEMVPTRIDLLAEKCLPENHSLQAELTPTTIVCDHRLIETALRNLIENANRYESTSDSIKLSVHQNRISVENDSSGVPEEVIDQLNHRRPVLSSKSGCGIGLALVKLIADIHNARFEISNDTDRQKVVASFEFRSTTDP